MNQTPNKTSTFLHIPVYENGTLTVNNNLDTISIFARFATVDVPFYVKKNLSLL
jgi:hypothetical protein